MSGGQSDEERIRDRAYRLWLEEGQPDGRARDHWELASELIAIEDSQNSTLKPIQSGETGPTGEPVEPILAVENEGEFPTLTDQGEGQAAPRRPAAPRKRAPARKASKPKA